MVLNSQLLFNTLSNHVLAFVGSPRGAEKVTGPPPGRAGTAAPEATCRRWKGSVPADLADVVAGAAWADATRRAGFAVTSPRISRRGWNAPVLSPRRSRHRPRLYGRVERTGQLAIVRGGWTPQTRSHRTG
jgi:hypothetical protein